MNIKVISFLKECDIAIEETKWGLKEYSNLRVEVQGSIKKFYRVQGNKVEIIFVDSKYSETNVDKIKANCDFIMVLVREITEKNNEYIKRVASIKNSLIFIGEDNATIKSFDNFAYLNELKKNETIKINSLIYGIINYELIGEIKNSKVVPYTMIGSVKSENISGNLVLSILKNLANFQYAKALSLYIYGGMEMNLKDKTYIEDPINEYLIGRTRVKIFQQHSEIVNAKTYFTLIANE